MNKLANSKTEFVKGKTNPLPVRLGTSNVNLEFIVIDHKDHDILLGLDWFNITKAGIFPSTNIIIFPNSDKVNELENNDLRDLYQIDDESIYQVDSLDDETVKFYEEESSWSFNEVTIKPEKEFSEEDKPKLTFLIEASKTLFAKNAKELGTCKIIEHEIELTDDLPVVCKDYRMSQKELSFLKTFIDECLEAKIIRKSTSPYNATPIMIPKPDGSMRPVIDYRALNKKTKSIKWPYPNITDLINKVASKGKIISVLDGKMGFWQIPLTKNSIPKTAWSCPYGHFEFLKVPFGIKNGPCEFQRIMDIILGDLDFVAVYMDDVCVFSLTLDEHIQHLLIVFERLRDANLKLNPEKCTWFSKEVIICGFIVSFQTIKTNPAKIQSLLMLKHPRNITEVRSFLGGVLYHKRHIKRFAELTFPIINLTKKNVPFIWSDECDNNFNELKNLLTSAPILRPPDFSKPFTLYTDASHYCVAYNLAQHDNNMEYTVEYGSKILKKAELNYSIVEKELLAILFGLMKCRPYLYGIKFKCVTDAKSLKWLNSFKDKIGRLCRWSYYLSMFDAEYIHRPGIQHGNVDFLSRPPIEKEDLDLHQINSIKSNP